MITVSGLSGHVDSLQINFLSCTYLVSAFWSRGMPHSLDTCIKLYTCKYRTQLVNHLRDHMCFLWSDILTKGINIVSINPMLNSPIFASRIKHRQDWWISYCFWGQSGFTEFKFAYRVPYGQRLKQNKLVNGGWLKPYKAYLDMVLKT